VVSAAVINAIGILAIFRYRKWAEKAKTYFMCFAAGVLLSSSLILALPQAVKNNSYAGFIALVGFLFMFFPNKIIGHYTKQNILTFGITAVEGIGIHSFIDRIIYTVTFQVSVLMGFLAGTGLVIHEFAESVITYLILIKGEAKERTAAWYAFLIAELTTPIGAFIAYPFVSRLGKLDTSLLLGFMAGVLLYVSASHLLPEAREYEKNILFLPFWSMLRWRCLLY